MTNKHLADFVRKEYALALKLKKNIVPVAHEEFDWPDISRLPKDCAGVMAMNAVKCVPLQLLLLNITFCALRRVLLSAFLSALSFVIFNNMMRYMGEYRDASIQKIKDALMDSS